MALDFGLLRTPGASIASGMVLADEVNKNILAKQAQERAIQRKKQLDNDLFKTFSKPQVQAADVAKLSVMYPELNAQFKQAWDIQSDAQQKAGISRASNVYAALEADRPEIAVQLLEEQAEAAANSGDAESAKAARTMVELVKNSPQTAKTSVALRLSGMMGPEKFTETFTKLQGERRTQQLQPSEMTKAQAEAHKAAVAANFAESEAALDLQKKGWDITKIQEDINIAKENTRIAALNAQIQRETNELKKQELQQKLEDAKRKRAEEIRTKTSELASYQASIDNSVSTIDRLLQNPELDNILGAVEGSKFYPSTLIGLVSPFSDADKRADAMADLETIQSQSFLNNLMEAKAQGGTFGSLTEKEGERLVGAVQSLKTKQSEKQFRNNMAEIQRLLMKSRDAASKKYGIPGTIPDTPNVQNTPEDITSITDYYLSGEGASGVPYRPQGQ